VGQGLEGTEESGAALAYRSSSNSDDDGSGYDISSITDSAIITLSCEP